MKNMTPNYKKDTTPMYKRYQHTFNEVGVDYYAFSEMFTNDDILYSKNPPEQVLNIRQEAAMRLLEVLRPHLTDRQADIVDLMYYFDESCQTDIADQLGFSSQSVVLKFLRGNSKYTNSKKCGVEGGICNKISRLCKKDEQFRALMQELVNEDDSSSLCRIVRKWFKTKKEYNNWLSSNIPASICE